MDRRSSVPLPANPHQQAVSGHASPGAPIHAASRASTKSRNLRRWPQRTWSCGENSMPRSDSPGRRFGLRQLSAMCPCGRGLPA